MNSNDVVRDPIISRDRRAICLIITVIRTRGPMIYLRSSAKFYGLDEETMTRRRIQTSRRLFRLRRTGKRSGLSRGMKRKVAIARSLRIIPRVLIDDEPTLGLEPDDITQIIGFLRDLRLEKKTIVLSALITSGRSNHSAIERRSLGEVDGRDGDDEPVPRDVRIDWSHHHVHHR